VATSPPRSTYCLFLISFPLLASSVGFVFIPSCRPRLSLSPAQDCASRYISFLLVFSALQCSINDKPHAFAFRTGILSLLNCVQIRKAVRNCIKRRPRSVDVSMKTQVPHLPYRHRIYTLHRLPVVGNPAYLSSVYCLFAFRPGQPASHFSFCPLLRSSWFCGVIPDEFSLRWCIFFTANPFLSLFFFFFHFYQEIRYLIYVPYPDFIPFLCINPLSISPLPPNQCIATNPRPISFSPSYFLVCISLYWARVAVLLVFLSRSPSSIWFAVFLLFLKWPCMLLVVFLSSSLHH
jgi:hypothetical protein